MGALSSVLAIPVRSIKESFDRRNKNRRQAKSEAKSAPTSRAPSPKGKKIARTQSLGPREVAAVSSPLRGEQAQAEVSKKVVQQNQKRVEKNIALEAPLPVPVPVAATSSLSKNNETANDQITNTKDDKMATDEDYMAFLDKANEDPSAGTSKASVSKNEFKITDEDVDIPSVLVRATKDAWYVSDADEPFVIVALKLPDGKDGLPNEETFAQLINHPSPKEAEISILDVGEWDPAGQYKEVVDAVREASKGSDVRVYRVEGEGSRVEYWVVGTQGGRLLGCKALGVES